MVFIDGLAHKQMEDFMSLDFDDEDPQNNWNMMSSASPPGALQPSQDHHQQHHQLLVSKCETPELTLLSHKPIMTTSNIYDYNPDYSPNGDDQNPQNIENMMLKIIETNDKHNERMMIQVRLKQVLLDYLKAKQHPDTTATTTGTPICNAGAPIITPMGMCSPTNFHSLSPTGETQMPGSVGDESSKILYNILTPPISPPDLGHNQFFIPTIPSEPKVINASNSNLSLISLNSGTGILPNNASTDTLDMTESIEKFYSESDSEKLLPMVDDMESNNTFMDSYSNDTNIMNNTTNNSSNKSQEYSVNASPLPVSIAPVASVQSVQQSSPQPSQSPPAKKRGGQGGRGRKQAPVAETPQQQQKRTAHLSAEFRYRTKLNDKISKLRQIVGPKSQLSKSGVLSRSIDLISKLQKSNTKLKEENKRIRLLLMQACNHLPNAAQATGAAPNGNAVYMQ